MIGFSLQNALIAHFLIGSVANGVQRPPLYLTANDLTFAVNVTVEEFSIWTESNSYVVNKVNNIFGHGDDSYGTNNGIKSLAVGETPTPYTSTLTITASPTDWSIPPSPTWAVPNTGYGSKYNDLFIIRSNILQRTNPFPFTPLARYGSRKGIMISTTGEHSRCLCTVDSS